MKNKHYYVFFYSFEEIKLAIQKLFSLGFTFNGYSNIIEYINSGSMPRFYEDLTKDKGESILIGYVHEGYTEYRCRKKLYTGTRSCHINHPEIKPYVVSFERFINEIYPKEFLKKS